MRRTLIPVVFIILVLLLSSLVDFKIIQPVKAAENYSDNFDDGNANGWTQQLGGWSVVNGEYRVSVGIVENGVSTVNGLSFSDCVIETQLRFTDSVGFRAGIVFRYSDNQHYYSLEISNEYDKIDLVKYLPANPEYGDLIAENVISINANVNYNLRLEAAGSNFNAYLNGQKVLSGTDNSYTSGLVGLRARRADVCFDNFMASGNIQSIPSTSVPSPTPTIQPVKPPQLSPGAFSDDFSSDSGAWQYLGSAYRDTANQNIVLTNADYSQAGVAFFKYPISGSFIASFSYKVGGGGFSGDGFTMFFYKQHYTTLDAGGSLGFTSSNQIVPGYGIEFDGWQNPAGDYQNAYLNQPINPPQGDPYGAYVGLLKDYAGNHLDYVNDSRVNDNNWHNVSVEVDGSSVSVSVDQGLVLQWSGVLDRTFDGFGFSGATGDATSWHVIDNFAITAHNLQMPSLTISSISSTSQSSFNVFKITGDLTFNGEGISGQPILLSYSVTGGESWQDLTLVYTGSDGSYSASWLPTVTGSYQLKATYKGDENYLGTSNIINFAIEPDAEQGVFSVTSNSTVTSLFFDSANQELSFNVTGDAGTRGYVNVCIPKSLINEASTLKVYLDGNKIDYTVQSQNDSWLLHFTYHHSSHSVTISLASSANVNGVKLGNLENYVLFIVIAILAIIIVVMALAFRGTKKFRDSLNRQA